jgi:hypothetical protein
MNRRGWRIAAASTIGTSHIKQGIVCQDSHACRIFSDNNGKALAALVASDGAGSASRADEGSQIACRTILEAVEVFLAAGNLVADIGLDVARSWVAMVQTAITFRAGESGRNVRDYACTLLVAVVAEDAAAFLQIGDGAMVVTDEVGEWTWIHWPQRGDYANTTFFVTEECATDRMAFDLISGPVDEVALFTDGIEALVLHYATKTVHAPFFEKMFIPVRASEAENIDESLSAGLERYLASPAVCQRTDDDKTLILASRRPPMMVSEVVAQ